MGDAEKLPRPSKPRPTTIVGENPDDPEIWQEIMEGMAAGAYPTLDALELMKARPENARAELWRILEKMPPDRKRDSILVAETLARLGDERGYAHLRKMLQVDEAEIRRRALLVYALDELEVGERDAEALMARLEDPDPAVRREAIQACGYQNLPGILPRFYEMLQRLGLPGRGRIAYWICRYEPPTKSLPALVEYLQDDDVLDRDTHWAVDQLATWAEELEPPLSKAAADAVEDFFAGELVTHVVPEMLGQGHFSQHLVGPLAKVAGPRSLPVLDRILAEAKDPVSRGSALHAIARLRKAKSLPSLREHVGDVYLRHYWIQAARAAVDDESRDEVRRLVHEHLDQLSMDREVIQLLTDLGEEDSPEVAARAGELSATHRSWLAWQQQGWTLEAVLADAYKLGLLSRKPSKKRIAELRSQWLAQWEGGRDFSEAEMLEPALEELGVAFSLDVESWVMPCPHDELVQRFGEIAGRRLKLTRIRQTRDSPEEPFTVTFAVGRDYYQFFAEENRDLFDVDAVHRALNYVLEDLGRQERFFTSPPGDGVAFYVFGRADAVESFASKYSLPWQLEP